MGGRFAYGPLSTCSCGAARIAAVAPGSRTQSAWRHDGRRVGLPQCPSPTALGGLPRASGVALGSDAVHRPREPPSGSRHLPRSDGQLRRCRPVHPGSIADDLPRRRDRLSYFGEARERGRATGALVLAKLLRHVRVRHGGAESVNAGASPEPCAHELSDAGASPGGVRRMDFRMRAHPTEPCAHGPLDAGASLEAGPAFVSDAGGCRSRCGAGCASAGRGSRSFSAGAQCGALGGPAPLQLPRAVSRLPQTRLPGLLVKGDGRPGGRAAARRPTGARSRSGGTARR